MGVFLTFYALRGIIILEVLALSDREC